MATNSIDEKRQPQPRQLLLYLIIYAPINEGI